MEIFVNLHPKFVHFPIAFFLLYIVVESIYLFSGRYFFSKAAQLLLTTGVLTALLTLFTGDQAATAAVEAMKNTPPEIRSGIQSLIDSHNQAATTMIWIFTGLLIYRSWFFIQTIVKKRDLEYCGIITASFVAIALLGCIFLYQTSRDGGNLVYKYGVGSKVFEQLYK